MSTAMTEFRITSDLTTIQDQIIDANFDEVRAWLMENLQPYRDMVVTEDSIPTAKTYRANIRKVKDRIEQSRKEAKNAALMAYTEFEQKCKALTGLCDEAAGAIDAQIKEFERLEKEAKIAGLRAFYDGTGDAEARQYLPFDRLYNLKWENKGYAPDTARGEIAAALESTARDLETIRSVGGENTAYLLDYYRQNHDLSATVRKGQELTAMRAAEEQRKREAAERRAREAAEDAERLAIETERLRGAVKVAEPAAETADRKREEEPVHVIDFRIWATPEQLAALKAFLVQSGIRYGRAP